MRMLWNLFITRCEKVSPMANGLQAVKYPQKMNWLRLIRSAEAL